MGEVHIIAIFTPKPGKVDRLSELLAAQVAEVHAKEDYCLRFIVTKQINEETPDFVLFETYKSEASIDQHLKEPHFLQMSKTLGAEDVLTKKPYVAKTITTGGFDLDMKLM
ncbi:hypothetical protein AYL99_11030 [Fonsecaea erecta]|uniref:ABM domain-containing protein n=1 Tax=Fonsecaea erecta TaxID=1367422 RepID=A0A178Z4C4_9EURO|nr:hypothetical protein AYL99_11030 [Fonsecaea erecta]OAP54582.1 hypothetical protein AYL99_11030 [Fonsecaea erecta]